MQRERDAGGMTSRLGRAADWMGFVLLFNARYFRGALQFARAEGRKSSMTLGHFADLDGYFGAPVES
ncbi:hypothetical protein [Sagittula sp.]|uniref:hypothetical protein n=2 Tax=Sagittula sp. TaxID=2038081 RepID=UPI0040585DD1